MEFNEKQRELLEYALEYLMGGELIEPWWTDEDINMLKSLKEQFSPDNFKEYKENRDDKKAIYVEGELYTICSSNPDKCNILNEYKKRFEKNKIKVESFSEAL